MPHDWSVSDVSLTIRLGLWALGRKTRNKVSLPYSEYMLSTCLITTDVDPGHLAEEKKVFLDLSTEIFPLP